MPRCSRSRPLLLTSIALRGAVAVEPGCRLRLLLRPVCGLGKPPIPGATVAATAVSPVGFDQALPLVLNLRPRASLPPRVVDPRLAQRPEGGGVLAALRGPMPAVAET